MRKKIIAFYDVLLLSVICGPLMICSILIFVFGKLHDLEWTLKYWYLVILFAVGIMLPIGCSLMIRYISIRRIINMSSTDTVEAIKLSRLYFSLVYTTEIITIMNPRIIRP